MTFALPDTPTITLTRQTYEKDGYVILRGYCNKDHVEQMIERVEQYCRDTATGLATGNVHYEVVDTRTIKSLFRMHVHDAFFDRLARDPRLTDTVSAMFPEGDPVVHDVGFFAKPARHGSAAPVHQDNAYDFYEPPHALKATIALDASTMENGVMYCQRGSHKRGLLLHHLSAVTSFSQTLADPVSTEDYSEVPMLLQPGDLLLHHTDTVHRSGPNTLPHPQRMLAMEWSSSHAVRNTEKYELSPGQTLASMIAPRWFCGGSCQKFSAPWTPSAWA